MDSKGSTFASISWENICVWNVINSLKYLNSNIDSALRNLSIHIIFHRVKNKNLKIFISLLYSNPDNKRDSISNSGKNNEARIKFC